MNCCKRNTTRDNDIQKLLADFKSLNINNGYFLNPIPNVKSEVIFTYPFKFGIWGTQNYIDQVALEVQRIVNEGHRPIITLEPFKDTGTDPLPLITGGTYDVFFTNLMNSINAISPNAIIRPMQEMETFQPRYPWSGKTPASYISAFQHLYTLNQGLGNNLKFLWTPAGDNASISTYYPGNSFTDFVGFSLYDFPDYVDLVFYGQSRTLLGEFIRKIGLITGITNKPIIIPEMGIATGDKASKFILLNQLVDLIKTSYPSLIDEIDFFNSQETLAGYTDLDYSIY